MQWSRRVGSGCSSRTARRWRARVNGEVCAAAARWQRPAHCAARPGMGVSLLRPARRAPSQTGRPRPPDPDRPCRRVPSSPLADGSAALLRRRSARDHGDSTREPPLRRRLFSRRAPVADWLRVRVQREAAAAGLPPALLRAGRALQLAGGGGIAAWRGLSVGRGFFRSRRPRRISATRARGEDARPLPPHALPNTAGLQLPGFPAFAVLMLYTV